MNELVVTSDMSHLSQLAVGVVSLHASVCDFDTIVELFFYN